MGPDAQGRPFAILLALVAASLVLVILGFVLRGRGQLRSRGLALGWAVLCIVPLFGAGALMFVHHAVDEATGKTRPGINSDPAHEAARP